MISIFDSDELNLRPIPPAEMLNAGQTIRGERQINQHDGKQITVLGSVRQMPDDNYQYLFQDITDRKQNEAERERMIDELEAKNFELERFAYTVSHDLKTPLITIRNFLGYLRKDIERGNKAEIVSDLTYIHEASDKMYRLLDNLLELTRIGRITNTPEWMPFAEVVEEAVKLVSGRISANQISVDVDSDLPVVYGDRIRLTEALQNLIENATKFIGDQPNPHIHIGTKKQADKIVFFVQDNGIGITAVYHEKIFNLFDRLDPAIDGTGDRIDFSATHH